MPFQTRVGDIGIGVCKCHKKAKKYTTVFISGADYTLDNNKVACTINTVGNSTCGHPTIAQTGSPNTYLQKLASHRINDVGANCGPYVVVSGSPDTIKN